MKSIGRFGIQASAILPILVLMACNGTTFKPEPKAVDEAQRKEDIDSTMDKLNVEMDDIDARKTDSRETCAQLRIDLQAKMAKYKSEHGENKGLESQVANLLKNSANCVVPTVVPSPVAGGSSSSAAAGTSDGNGLVKNPQLVELEAKEAKVSELSAAIKEKSVDLKADIDCEVSLSLKDCISGLTNILVIADSKEIQGKAFDKIILAVESKETSEQGVVRIAFSNDSNKMKEELSKQPVRDEKAAAEKASKKDEANKLVIGLSSKLEKLGIIVVNVADDCSKGLTEFGFLVEDAVLREGAIKTIQFTSGENSILLDSQTVTLKCQQDATDMRKFLTENVVKKDSEAFKKIEAQTAKIAEMTSVIIKSFAAEKVVAACSAISQSECLRGLTTLANVAQDSSIKGKAFTMLIVSNVQSDMDDRRAVFVKFDMDADAMKTLLAKQMSSKVSSLSVSSK